MNKRDLTPLDYDNRKVKNQGIQKFLHRLPCITLTSLRTRNEKQRQLRIIGTNCFSINDFE